MAQNKSKELTIGDYGTDSPSVEQEQKDIHLGGGTADELMSKRLGEQAKSIAMNSGVQKTTIGNPVAPTAPSADNVTVKAGGDIPKTQEEKDARIAEINNNRQNEYTGEGKTRQLNLGTTYIKRGNRLFYVDADGQTVGAKRGTINGEIYYRVPNSNDVIKYNEDGTAEVISEQEFQDRKYNGLSARRRRQMSEADKVREAYADFRELNKDIPTQEEFDTILAKYGGKNGMWSWQTIYGGKHGRFNTAMGGGALFGHANAQNMKDMEEQYQNELKAEIAANKNIEDAVMTKDENGNVRGGKVVTSIELPDGTEKALNVNDANEIVEYIRKWGSDPRKNTEEEIKGLQELLRSKGFEISEDAINGAQTMNGVLDAILTVKDNDKMAELRSERHLPQKEGVVRNEDGTYTLPSEPTMDDLNAYYQQKKDAFDMNFKNREVERARNRVGLVDIAAGVAEALRGSQGANINERNWYNPYYKNLDDQQQRNYNYYVAKQDQAHREKLALEQANAQRKQQAMLKQMDIDAARQLQADKDLAAMDRQEAKDASAYERALVRAGVSKEKAKSIAQNAVKYKLTVSLGDGNIYGIREKSGMDSGVISTLFSKLDSMYGSASNQSVEIKKLWTNTVSRAKKSAGLFSATDYLEAVNQFLSSPDAPKEAKEEAKKILDMYSDVGVDDLSKDSSSIKEEQGQTGGIY